MGAMSGVRANPSSKRNKVVTYGMETALDHTFSYLGRYLLLGFVPIGWVGCTTSDGGIAAILAILHVISAAMLFPGAMIINRIALRLARRRAWDRERWRAWLAATLGVATIWSGLFSAAVVGSDGPQFLKSLLGPWATLVHYVGIVLVGSTVSLTAAWSLPWGERR
jgi:hypothetical protein